MIAGVKRMSVDKVDYIVWSDFITRSTYAMRLCDYRARTLRGGGYISKEATIRRFIRDVFGKGAVDRMFLVGPGLKNSVEELMRKEGLAE